MAQDCTIEFTSPIDYKTVLSGSFGEPRTRHFHAGIDFKQRRGIPNDTIYAVADGHVSRISVQGEGYGNALYIDHKCNKRSVYAHLYQYAPFVKNFIDSIRTARKVYNISYDVPIDIRIPVKRGQYIGIMGNTGRSSGPHLHFEIRHALTDNPINPALLGIKPNDIIPPKIVGVMLYELGPNDEQLSKKFYPAIEKDGIYELPNSVIKTNNYKVGIGIRTYDMMNGASNHNGIYSLELKVAEKNVFAFSLDSIPFEVAKYIHSHMDYEEKVNKKYVTKCFASPYNKLEIYSAQQDGGRIYPYKNQITPVSIEVGDIENNKALIVFGIERTLERPSIDSLLENQQWVMPNEVATLSNEFSTIEINKETFTKPELITRPISDAMSIDMRQATIFPLFRNIKVKHHIAPTNDPKAKFCFTSMNDKGKQVRHKTKWENDSTLVTFVGELKEYFITLDETPPTIQILKLPSKRNKELLFRVQDNFEAAHNSDAIKVNVTSNGQWQLCAIDGKTSTYSCQLDLKQQDVLEIKVVATDAATNRKEINRQVKL